MILSNIVNWRMGPIFCGRAELQHLAIMALRDTKVVAHVVGSRLYGVRTPGCWICQIDGVLGWRGPIKESKMDFNNLEHIYIYIYG